MRGFLLTASQAERSGKAASIRQVRELTVSVAVGIICALLVVNIRLHLGLPGHKAVIWLMPVILARLLGGCRTGATAGAISAAFTASALGGRIAGSLLGLPMVGFAGVLVDVAIGYLQKRRPPLLLAIAIVGVAGSLANLLCLGKRLMAPAGPACYVLPAAFAFWFKFFSYAFFGFISGAVAAGAAAVITRRRHVGQQDDKA